MNKRVHEIAKERGLPAKDVLARLKAAGVDVKASSSSVDEEVAKRVLANGGDAKSGAARLQAAALGRQAQATAPKREPHRPEPRGHGRPARPPRNRRQAPAAERLRPAAGDPAPAPTRPAGGRAGATSAPRATRCRASARRATPADGAGS